MSDVKRLYRSRHERELSGVCGGIAEYIDLDPTVVRVIFVVGTIMTGFFPGLFIYFVLALIMPKEPLGRGSGDID